MGKEKVVLDTNILVSAFGWCGKPKIIFERILDGEFELVVCREQLRELARVLAYPKFKFNEEQRLKFMAIVYSVATVVDISGNVRVVQDDQDDDAILESAIVSGSDFLVSGDEHLLEFGEFENIRILTASEFLELVDDS